MKKFLSLVLALVMTVSLVTIGASAKTYTDASKINYKEAVDVVSACSIIDGYTDGSFNPAGTLTRGAAAKIICNMILGPTTASALGADTKPFSDVATNNVFAGYIAYCSSQGIINGYADGTFKPAGTLTGHAFLKMLLGALGYDSAIEGFTGANWSVSVAKLATNLKLTKGNSAFVGSKAITREEACLYAFNTLKANMVEYASKGTSITINGAVISSGASKATVQVWDSSKLAGATNAGETTEYNGVADNTVQFCEMYFSKLALVPSTTLSADSFGRPAHQWNYNNKKVGLYTDAPVLTYTTTLNEKTLYTDLGVEGYAGSDSKFVAITALHENGVKEFTTTITSATNYSVALENGANWSQNSADNTAIIAKGDTTTVRGSGEGTTFEIYETGTDNQYIAVAITEQLGLVTGVTKADANKETKRTITIDSTYTFETEDFARGDKVLYTYAGTAAKSVVAPKTLTGSATKSTSAGVYTINGAEYKISNRHDTVTTTLGNTYTWYLDSCGNLIADKSASDATVYYGYLLQYNCSDYSAGNALGTGTTAAGEAFKFVNASGATVTLNGAYTTNSNGTVNKFVASGSGNLSGLSGTGWVNDAKGGLFGYELDANGKICKVYTPDTVKNSSKKTLTKGTAQFDGKYLSDKTVVFYINSTTVNASQKIAAYTGYANAPTKDTTANYYTIGTDTAASPLKALLMVVSDVDASTTAKYVYFASSAYTSETTTDGTVVTYSNVYLDGVKGELKFTSAQSVAAGDLFTYTTNTTTGKSTLGSSHVAQNSSATEITSVQSTYFVATNVYYTDSETEYYLVDKTAKTAEKVSAITAVSSNNAYTVNLIYTDATSGSTTATANVVYFSVD